DTPLLILPESLPDGPACIANCAAATVAGAFRTAAARSNENVLIFGAGMLGLTAAAMARSMGANEIIVVDVDATRLARAAEFGASTCLPVTGDGSDLIEAVRRCTAGRGVDWVLEVSGAATAMEAALQGARVGGRIVFVGAVAPTRPLAVDGESIVRRML